MRILYVGDVMAKPGREVLSMVLPGIKKEFDPHLTIVQAENSSDEGKGPGESELKEMRAAGAEFFTGGNHSLRGKDSYALYNHEPSDIIRPANAKDLPGRGWNIVSTAGGDVLVASLLGQTVGRQHVEFSNPLESIDDILEMTKEENLAARILNFHGDFTSEKRVIGYYLDGKVTAVVGDHLHVPTADAMVLPNGTAHITDVGMCGTLHSSLGVKKDQIIERWKTGRMRPNEIETTGPFQFNAVLISVGKSGLAESIQQIQKTI